MSYKYSKRSKDNLRGVHPLLRKVFKELIKKTPIDFIITEGVRSAKRQKQLVKEKKSWTFNSFHLYGLAVDIVPLIDGNISWDLDDFLPIIEELEAIALKEDIDVRSGYAMWGKDAPHFQLHTINGIPARKVYDVRKNI